jgi:hypothetical protein
MLAVAKAPAPPSTASPGPSLENLRTTQQAQRLLAIRRRANGLAARLLREISTLQRVKDCGHHAITDDGTVWLRARPTDNGTRVNATSLCTCGSGTACPSCADKIMPRRAAEILALIDAHYQAGGRVISMTHTLAHSRDDSLKGKLWPTLSPCWAAASGVRKTTKRAMADHVVGWVRNVEATWGERFGWHLHTHSLWLVTADTTDDDADRIAAASFNDWRDKAIDLGMNAPQPQAFSAKVLTLTEAVEQVAGYLAKSTYETAAWELAGGPRKLPARGHHTPFGLLELLVEQLADDDGELDDAGQQRLALWREWEQAAKGRRMVTYSKGVRALYGLDVDSTDEELADDDLDLGAIFAGLSADTWAAIRYSSFWQLQAHVELGTLAEAVDRLDAWLAEHQLPGAIRPDELLAESRPARPQDQRRVKGAEAESAAARVPALL